MGSHQWQAWLNSGLSEWPLISIMLGLAGACAIVTSGTLLARVHWLNFLRYCGEHSIVIYLAFFLPMAATRTLLLRAGLIHDIGAISLVVHHRGHRRGNWRYGGWRSRSAQISCSSAAALWIAPKKPQPNTAAGRVVYSNHLCRRPGETKPSSPG